VPLGNAAHLAVTVLADTHGYQHQDVSCLASPAPFEHYAVQVHIGVVTSIGRFHQASMC
jgi:hypothetical protein